MKNATKGALILDLVILVLCLSIPSTLKVDRVAPKITVTGNDFDGCFSVHDRRIHCGLSSAESVTVDEAASALSSSGIWIDDGLTPIESHTVYFTDRLGSGE